MFPHSKHINMFCSVGYSCYFFSVLVHHCRPSSLSIISDCSQRRHWWYCKYTHVTNNIFLSFSPPERKQQVPTGIRLFLPNYSFKGIVHLNAVNISSPSCCSKHIWLSFLCWTQKKTLWMLIVHNKAVLIPLTSIVLFVQEPKPFFGNQNCLATTLEKSIPQ